LEAELEAGKVDSRKKGEAKRGKGKKWGKYNKGKGKQRVRLGGGPS